MQGWIFGGDVPFKEMSVCVHITFFEKYKLIYHSLQYTISEE